MCEIRARSEAKRENYSIETQLNIKRRRGAVPVPIAISTDQTDHWPKMATTIGRCKNPGCKGRSRVICRKYSTYDVNVNLCLLQERNCF